jgi:hypothetical protein
MADLIITGMSLTGGGITITLPPASAIIADTYFNYTTILLSGDGTNNATNATFVDSSTNNFTITRSGNTTQGTYSPYGSNWSNYFEGTDDFLSYSSNTTLNFGTGNFTVECWINLGNVTGSKVIVTGTDSDSFGLRYGTGFGANNGIGIYRASIADLEYCSFSFLPSVWYHVAVVRQSSAIKFFVDGTQQTTVGSGGGSFNYPVTSNVRIGTGDTGLEDYTGYISNLRVTKSAVYTANFTPSTTPLTAISGTSLLTCQSNRFIDNSTNNFAITRNGDVSVQRFSPFSPAAAYSAATIGGSAYFDGTGDYLSVPAGPFVFSTSSFTVEAWVYTTAYNTSGVGGEVVIDNWAGSPSGSYVTNQWQFWISTAGVVKFEYATGASTTVGIGTGTVPLNTWTHIAAVRNSTTVTVYVNGVASGSGTVSQSLGVSAAGSIARQTVGSTYSFTGYITDARIVNGTAVYTTTFTPPTAPLTAISGTSLLTNFTNAGIIDNAMMNNLETVGDAKISTVQSKFGGSSMSFDGTGDYLYRPDSVNVGFGTGNFTIECWVNTSAKDIVILDIRSPVDPNVPGVFFIQSSTGYIGYYDNTVGSISGTTNVATGSWIHLAWTRSGTTFRMFVNGTQEYSGTNSGNFGTSRPIYVGASNAATALFNGYIDDFRITKGFARYTANFTPPTAALPTQ